MIELCNSFVARLGYAPWEKHGENIRFGKLSLFTINAVLPVRNMDAL